MPNAGSPPSPGKIAGTMSGYDDDGRATSVGVGLAPCSDTTAQVPSLRTSAGTRVSSRGQFASCAAWIVATEASSTKISRPPPGAAIPAVADPEPEPDAGGGDEALLRSHPARLPRPVTEATTSASANKHSEERIARERITSCTMHGRWTS